MSSETRFLRLILNGKSAGRPEIRDAVGRIRELGHRLEVRVTWEFGDAARYAGEAVADAADVVIAGGGDGTINEVVTGLMATDRPTASALAVLPLGTANDFANGCRIPVDDPLAALQLAATGDVKTIDIGKANERYFVNVASGGFGAQVTINTPAKLKNALGGAAYSVVGIATAATMKPYACRVQLSDGQSHTGEVFVLAVGNGRQCGGGQQVAPRAVLDDGKLDLMVVHDVDLIAFGSLLTEWVTLGDESNQTVSYVQLESFQIDCEQPLPINLDGEPLQEKHYDFRAVPQAIRLVLPPEAADLTSS